MMCIRVVVLVPREGGREKGREGGREGGRGERGGDVHTGGSAGT